VQARAQFTGLKDIIDALSPGDITAAAWMP
jgi:hypothetical protein